MSDLASGLTEKRLREALESAEDWMESDGCDCGTDEPRSCGLCLAADALALPKTQAEKDVDKLLAVKMMAEELVQHTHSNGLYNATGPEIRKSIDRLDYACKEAGPE